MAFTPHKMNIVPVHTPENVVKYCGGWWRAECDCGFRSRQGTRYKVGTFAVAHLEQAEYESFRSDGNLTFRH